MQDGAFYVYTLKDPRSSPAKPFYVGKGVGTRAWDHLLLRQDDTLAKLKLLGVLSSFVRGR